MRTFRRCLLRSTTALTLAAGLLTAMPSVSEAETVVTVVPAVATAGQTMQFAAAHTEIDGNSHSLLVCRTPAAQINMYGYPLCTDGIWARGFARSGQVTTASFEPSAADIGVNDYYAFRCTAFDCIGPFHGTFTVAPGVADTFVSDECDTGGVNVLSGIVFGAYAKARWKQVDGRVLVCVAAEYFLHYGGRLVFSAGDIGGAVNVDQDAASVAACAVEPNNVSVQSGTVLGGQPYWIHVTPAPAGSSDAAWVCIRFTSTLGVRLRLRGTDGGAFAAFTADPSQRRTPAYTMPAWPAAGPSATCTAAPSANGAFFDVVVGNERAALYAWDESATTRHHCLRGGGTGGRLTVKTDAASSVAVGSSTAPCPFDVVTRTDAPTYGLYLSDPANPGLPVSVCGAVAGSAVSVTVSAPDPGVVTWSPDPA